MGVPAEVEAGFTRTRAAVHSVEHYVRETLRPYAEQRKYVFEGRVKALSSLAEKLETGRFASWSTVDDLYACSLVIPTAADEANVLDHLRSVFDVVEVRSRDTRAKPPDVFRFDTTRVICQLLEQPGIDRPPGAESILFEVQIPSVFQYAWSVVTRDFVYKTDDIDWRRQRLVSQLKAAVEQIETIIRAFDATAQAVVVSGYAETDAKTRCAATFRYFFEQGLINSALKPESWSRFAESLYALVKSYARRGTPEAMDSLAADTETFLRNMPPDQQPVSGSLFQMVVGIVAAGGGAPPRHLRDFYVVDSRELRELYEVSTIPRPVLFDLPI